jgi:hypothetical protein
MERDSAMIDVEPTETDMGKCWIIRENGNGHADLHRPRSPRQREWLQRAVDAGWLSRSGRLTTIGQHLAAEYESSDE